MSSLLVWNDREEQPLRQQMRGAIFVRRSGYSICLRCFRLCGSARIRNTYLRSLQTAMKHYVKLCKDGSRSSARFLPAVLQKSLALLRAKSGSRCCGLKCQATSCAEPLKGAAKLKHLKP